MNKIILHIDHLVLEGIDSQIQSDYVLGLQQGLQHLLGEGKTVDKFRNIGEIRQLSIQSNALTKNTSAKLQGINTARHIVGGINSHR